MNNEFTDHQRDIITFALIYAWANLISLHKYAFEGKHIFTMKEIEDLLKQLDVPEQILIDYKVKLMEKLE